MNFAYALWYLRNGHMIATPMDDTFLNVYFLSPDNFELYSFRDPKNVCRKKIQEEGETRWISEILSHRSILHTSSLTLPLSMSVDWFPLLKFDRSSYKDKIAEQCVKELSCKRIRMENTQEESFYLDQIIASIIHHRDSFTASRYTIMHPKRDKEIYQASLQIQYCQNRANHFLNFYRVTDTTKTRYNLTTRDLIFQWTR